MRWSNHRRKEGRTWAEWSWPQPMRWSPELHMPLTDGIKYWLLVEILQVQPAVDTSLPDLQKHTKYATRAVGSFSWTLVLNLIPLQLERNTMTRRFIFFRDGYIRSRLRNLMTILIWKNENMQNRPKWTSDKYGVSLMYWFEHGLCDPSKSHWAMQMANVINP